MTSSRATRRPPRPRRFSGSSPARSSYPPCLVGCTRRVHPGASRYHPGNAALLAAIQIDLDLGLGHVAFLTGFEIDVNRLREPLGRPAGRAFAVSISSALPAPSCFSRVGPGSGPGFLMVVFVRRQLACSFPWSRAASLPATIMPPWFPYTLLHAAGGGPFNDNIIFNALLAVGATATATETFGTETNAGQPTVTNVIYTFPYLNPYENLNYSACPAPSQVQF
jgi:hypothetical protein